MRFTTTTAKEFGRRGGCSTSARKRRAARLNGKQHRRHRPPPAERVLDSDFLPLNAEFGFTLDVAADGKNARCAKYYTREDDGLAQPWAPQIVWCNPPFFNPDDRRDDPLRRWVRKAY